MGRFALLIGNAEYEDEKLHQLSLPEADVTALKEVLLDKNIGAFDEIVSFINPNWFEIQPAITKFFKNRDKNDFLVMFYAGHGVKDRAGQLYLTFKNSEHSDLDGTAIPDSFIARQMDRSRSESQLLILDCCYSGAFGREARSGLGTSVGLRETYGNVLEGSQGSGRMILTATDSIQFAWEGDSVLGISSNSVFTRFLIKGLRDGDADIDRNGIITIDELYNYIYTQVRSLNSDQEPQLLTRSGKHWGEMAVAVNPKLASLDISVNNLPKEVVENIECPDINVRLIGLEKLSNFSGKTKYREEVRSILQNLILKDEFYEVRVKALEMLTKASEITNDDAKDETRVEPIPSPKLVKKINILDVLPEPFEWCKVPKGYVVMGQTSYITFEIQPFLMAKYPVTYEQFQVFVDDKDGFYNDEWWEGLDIRHEIPGKQKWPNRRNPRENVSWYDSIAFCRWLSSKLSYEVRLPTEWEWEWAGQGDDRFKYPWGDKFNKLKCNTSESGIGRTTPVDAYPEGTSPFGILGMSGNVWERCINKYNNFRDVTLSGKDYRGLRGGSWRYTERFAEITHRHKCNPEKRFDDGGFRIIAVSRPLI